MGCDLASGCYIFPSSWSARASAFPAPSFISWSFLAGRRRWPPSMRTRPRKEKESFCRHSAIGVPYSSSSIGVHVRTYYIYTTCRLKRLPGSSSSSSSSSTPTHSAFRSSRENLSSSVNDATTQHHQVHVHHQIVVVVIVGDGGEGQERRHQPAGPERPPPLTTILPSGTTSSSSSSPQHRRPAKRPRRVNVSGSGSDDNVRAPPALAAAPGPLLILYEHTPKVIHVHADEFKALVQRLTGRQPTPPGRGGGGGQEAVSGPLPSQQTAGDDPLVLTLGQQHAALPPSLPLDDHHAPPVLLPSPGGAVGGLLLSPGSFLFSPATMQAIQELIS